MWLQNKPEHNHKYSWFILTSRGHLVEEKGPRFVSKKCDVRGMRVTMANWEVNVCINGSRKVRDARP